MPEIPIDLSKLFIIISINSLGSFDSALANRLPVISFNNYTMKDKIKIGRKYLLPRLLRIMRFRSDDILISKDTMEYIINKSHYRNEAGIRQLERNLRIIIERLNILKNTPDPKKLSIKYVIKNISFPLTLTDDMVDNLFKEYKRPQSQQKKLTRKHHPDNMYQHRFI